MYKVLRSSTKTSSGIKIGWFCNPSVTKPTNRIHFDFIEIQFEARYTDCSCDVKSMADDINTYWRFRTDLVFRRGGGNWAIFTASSSVVRLFYWRRRWLKCILIGHAMRAALIALRDVISRCQAGDTELVWGRANTLNRRNQYTPRDVSKPVYYPTFHGVRWYDKPCSWFTDCFLHFQWEIG
jgi:hypothetical protein